MEGSQRDVAKKKEKDRNSDGLVWLYFKDLSSSEGKSGATLVTVT